MCVVDVTYRNCYAIYLYSFSSKLPPRAQSFIARCCVVLQQSLQLSLWVTMDYCDEGETLSHFDKFWVVGLPKHVFSDDVEVSLKVSEANHPSDTHTPSSLTLLPPYLSSFSGRV